MRVRGLVILLVIPLLLSPACRHTGVQACSLVTKADVERVVGLSVTDVVLEAEHAVSMADRRVMHSTASCAYLLPVAEKKPRRIKIDVEKYSDPAMMSFDFVPWKGAQSVTGFGEKAWQDTTALEILHKDTILVIETDPTSESPREPIPPSSETEDYPRVQDELAKIALGRL